MNFQDKTIVVTGAGGGVGRELVLQLLAKGASVAAVDVSEKALEATKKAAEGQAPGLGGALRSEALSLHVADITDRDRVSRLPAEAKAVHGKVDGIINNAGIIQPFVTLSDLDIDAVNRIMNINFYGMMNVTRAFIPSLAERPEAQIGNVSSMGGFLPVPGQAVYGASKAAVKIATEGLRLELSRTNIGVSLILPGGIETDIKKNSGLVEDGNAAKEKESAGLKLTSPAEAARAILAGLEKNKAKILIGKDAKIMDFLYRLFPESAGKLIARVMSGNHGGIFNETERLRDAAGKSA